MSDAKAHDPLCRVNRGGQTCNCSLSLCEKPSPGPWRWNDDRTVLRSPREDGRPGPGPIVLSMPDDYSQPPDPADAALIADAPAMLELARDQVMADCAGIGGAACGKCWGCRRRTLLEKHGRG